MRPGDKVVFSKAAVDLKLWILVRRTNPESLKYIGVPGFTSKPIDCKAKTAQRNHGVLEVGGLVVDPTLVPGAFLPAKLEEAKSEWKKFLTSSDVLMPAGRYRINGEKSSPRYGAVTLRGEFLHGDYDLYDVIDPKQPFRNLAAVEKMHGQDHMRGANVIRVMNYVNEKIGAGVVQHGGEAQYREHRDQPIDAFGPNGEECTILNGFSVRAWYESRFEGRKTLGG